MSVVFFVLLYQPAQRDWPFDGRDRSSKTHVTPWLSVCVDAEAVGSATAATTGSARDTTPPAAASPQRPTAPYTLTPTIHHHPPTTTTLPPFPPNHTHTTGAVAGLQPPRPHPLRPPPRAPAPPPVRRAADRRLEQEAPPQGVRGVAQALRQDVQVVLGDGRVRGDLG